MGPQYFCWSGMWWLFPLMGIIGMLFFFAFMMFFCRNRSKGFKGSYCGPWSNHNDNTDNGKQHETAIDILNKRYASGEISKEEFERIKKDISNQFTK